MTDLIPTRRAAIIDRLEDERWRLLNEWPESAFLGGRARERLAKIDAELAALREQKNG